MPRADVTVTITDAVVRVRAREATLSTVVRITTEKPSPQSQPTLYNNQTQIQSRNGRVSRSTRLLLYAMEQSKAESRGNGHDNRRRCASSSTRGHTEHRGTQHHRKAKPATESLTRGH